MKTIDTLLADEAEAQATLRQAEEDYKKTSLSLRVQIGRLFAAERARANLSVFQMAVMLGTNRMKVFATENPDKVPNPFSVQMMADMLEGARKAADACEAMGVKPVRKGRPAKFKTSN